MAKAQSDHITDTVSDSMGGTGGGNDASLPGPSPNPMTNALIHEVVLRSVGRLSRQTVQKAILGRQYGSRFAKEAIDNRSLTHTLATYGVAKVATRSVPGAVLVGAGLLAKTLFDRAKGKKTARKTGERQLEEQADPGSMM